MASFATCFTITELDYDTYTRSTFHLCFYLCCLVSCAESFLFHIRNKSLMSLLSLFLLPIFSFVTLFFTLSFFLAQAHYYHIHLMSTILVGIIYFHLTFLFLAFPHHRGMVGRIICTRVTFYYYFISFIPLVGSSH